MINLSNKMLNKLILTIRITYKLIYINYFVSKNNLINFSEENFSQKNFLTKIFWKNFIFYQKKIFGQEKNAQKFANFSKNLQNRLKKGKIWHFARKS